MAGQDGETPSAQESSMRRNATRYSFKVSLVYWIAGGLWILLSDRAVLALVGSDEWLVSLQMYKGWAFVALTGGLLFLILRNQFQSVLNESYLRSQAQQRLLSVIEGSNDGFWDWFDLTDPDRMWWSHRFFELIGYEPNEFEPTFETFADLLHPDDRTEITQLTERLSAEKKDFETEYRIRSKSGEYRWFRARGRIFCDQAGNRVRMAGSVRDVTDYRHAEERLRQSEARYRELFESNPHPMWVYDLGDLRFLAINDTAIEKYGYSREEFLSMTLKDIRPEEDIPKLVDVVASINAEPNQTGLWRHLLKDGRTIYVEATSHGVHWEGRNARLVLAHDITERLTAEQELRATKSTLEALVESSPFAITHLDLDRRIKYCNRAAEQVFGWKFEDLVGNVPPYIPPDDLDEFFELTTRLIEGEGFQIEHAIRTRKDGSRVDVKVTAAPLRDSEGQVIGMMSIVQDISEWVKTQQERDRIEEEFRQAQKMEAVGRLAGGIAHDFNNMLNVILGYTDLILIGLDPNDRIRPDLLEIKEAAEHSAGLTRQLLAFSRKQVAEPKAVDLNEAIRRQSNMIGRLIGEDIRFVVRPQADLWRIHIDPSQIDQVLANLVVNARDAIGGVGTVTLETSNVTWDERQVVGMSEVPPGDYVMLAVSDTGCGMDKPTLERIFEPFYTTKVNGEGTGLGLSTVYGIVKQNEGAIHVYSEPGGGTTFKIYFPRHLGDAKAVSQPMQVLSLEGSETILLVEDEQQLLELTKRMLTRYGYQVLAAPTPEGACALARNRPDGIALLLTDVVMPAMNGRELQIALQSICPRMKTLFMSGYTAEVIAKRGILESGVDFIQKPFTHRELAQKIRVVLETVG